LETFYRTDCRATSVDRTTLGNNSISHKNLMFMMMMMMMMMNKSRESRNKFSHVLKSSSTIYNFIDKEKVIT